MSIEPGTRIGPYEVQDLLGRGAMGVVYKAWHEALARPAAVKVLQAIAPDADASARFRREAQSIAQMRHPNILNVFDFGEFEGVPYMIVEFVPGGSLADRMKAGRLSRTEAIRVLRGIASGLDYAHAQGVVHRDVKPANVLMHDDGTTVLADFGLAKLLEGASMKSQTGATTGTPAYMAPEQVTGSAVGPPADRYALASVAYELLTGSVPFETGGILELLYAQVHREPPPPSSKAPELAPAVDAVLLRGLAKQPAERWDSCIAMIDALDHAFDRDVAATMPVPSEPFVAPVAAASPLASKPRPRRRWWVAGAALIVLLLIAGLAALAAARSSGGDVSITLDSSEVTLGQTITISADGLPPRQTGLIQLDSAPVELGRFAADDNGTMQKDVRIPTTVDTGPHTISLCWATACHGATALTVSERPTQAPPPTPTPTPSRVFHPSIVVSNITPKPGDKVNVVGKDFDPTKPYAIDLKQGTGSPRTLLSPGQVQPNGTFTATVTMPSVPPGPALIVACIVTTPLNPTDDCGDQQITVQK